MKLDLDHIRGIEDHPCGARWSGPSSSVGDNHLSELKYVPHHKRQGAVRSDSVAVKQSRIEGVQGNKAPRPPAHTKLRVRAGY